MVSLEQILWFILVSFSHNTHSQQYEQIYFDDFGDGNGWVVIQGSVILSQSSHCLWTTYCLKLTNVNAIAERRSISTNGYYDIHITFDINTVNYTWNDHCEVYYSTNYGNTWNFLARYDENSDGSGQYLSPPSNADDDSGFEIRVVNNVRTNHKDCFIDSLRIMGIAITPSPTGTQNCCQ